MPSPYSDFKRDGLDKIIKLAQVLCRLVLAFKAVIEDKYSGYPVIIALLASIESLCDLLPEAKTAFDSIGAEDDPFPEDTGDLAGINPLASPPPDPEV